jgi:hypothetical protein
MHYHVVFIMFLGKMDLRWPSDEISQWFDSMSMMPLVRELQTPGRQSLCSALAEQPNHLTPHTISICTNSSLYSFPR